MSELKRHEYWTIKPDSYPESDDAVHISKEWTAKNVRALRISTPGKVSTVWNAAELRMLLEFLEG